jgi:hypothetical protein
MPGKAYVKDDKLILEFDLSDSLAIEIIEYFLARDKHIPARNRKLESQLEEFHKHRRISTRIYLALRRNMHKATDLKELCLLIATGDIKTWNHIGEKTLVDLRKAFQPEIEEFGYARHTEQKG